MADDPFPSVLIIDDNHKIGKTRRSRSVQPHLFGSRRMSRWDDVPASRGWR